MSTIIEHAIGPSFGAETAAAGLAGLPFSWSETAVAADAELPADKLAILEAVIAAHDPTKPGPPTGPIPSCTKLGLIRAFRERGWWPTVKAMIASDAEMQDDWDAAIELRVTDPIVQKAVAALPMVGLPALTDADVLALIARANELVA